MSRAMGVARTAMDLRSLSMAVSSGVSLPSIDVDEPLPGRGGAGEAAEQDGIRGDGGDGVVVHDVSVVAGLGNSFGEGELPFALAVDFDVADGAEGVEGVAERAVGAGGVVEGSPGDALGAEAGGVGAGHGEAVGVGAGDGVQEEAHSRLDREREELRWMHGVQALEVGGEGGHRNPQLVLKRYFCSSAASRSGVRAPTVGRAGSASARRPAVRASTAGTAARIWRMCSAIETSRAGFAGSAWSLTVAGWRSASSL